MSRSSTYRVVMWSSRFVLLKVTTWFTQMMGPANGACTYNYLELKMVKMLYAVLILWIRAFTGSSPN